MFIRHGIYYWRRRIVAFRNDYCLACEAPRRTVQMRAFHVWHVFWIPLLPLGFWNRWVCATCFRFPHRNVKTRFGFKLAGLFILLLLGTIFWAMPVDPDDRAMWWTIRIGAPIALLISVLYMTMKPEGLPLKDKLRLIAPATDTVCPICGAQMLTISSQVRCPNCGAVRTQLV